MNKKTIIFLPWFKWDSSLLHREHELAKYFSLKGYEVIFVEKSIKIPETHRVGKLKISRIWLLPYLRGRIGLIYRINDWLGRKQIGRITRSCGGRVIYFISNPNWAFSFTKNRDEVIYDISDDYRLFAKNKKWARKVQKYEEALILKADKITYTSEFLLNKIPKGKASKLLSNGVDLSCFEDSKTILSKDGFNKIAGYIGGIFDWVDLGLIKDLALENPEIKFVLVGPTDNIVEVKNLTKIKNVFYLGSKKRDEIHDYFASLDIGLMPFRGIGEYPRLESADSNKIYQYAYFGYPIVATAYPQTEKLKDLLFVSRTRQEYLRNFKKALNIKAGNQDLKNFSRKNSWESKTSEMIKFIDPD